MKATVLTEAYIQQIIEEETRSILIEEQCALLLKEGIGASICEYSRDLDDFIGDKNRFIFEDIIGMFIGAVFPIVGDALDMVLAVRSYCRGACFDALIGMFQAMPIVGLLPAGLKMLKMKVGQFAKLSSEQKALRNRLFKEIIRAIRQLGLEAKQFQKFIREYDDNAAKAQVAILNRMRMGNKNIEKAIEAMGYEDGRIGSFLKGIAEPYSGRLGYVAMKALGVARAGFQILLAACDLIFYFGPQLVKMSTPDDLAKYLEESGFIVKDIDDYVCKFIAAALDSPAVLVSLIRDILPADVKSKNLDRMISLQRVPKQEQEPLMTYDELAKEWGYGSSIELLLGLQDPLNGFNIDHTRINKANVEVFLRNPLKVSGLKADVKKLHDGYQTTAVRRGFHHKGTDIIRTPEEVRQIIAKAREGI